jgi:topoisomerase-4 subunit A
MVLLSDVVYPLVRISYGGADSFRADEDIDAEQFITVKGFKAKGKRLTTYEVESIVELEPVRFPEEPEEEEESETEEIEDVDPDAGKSEQQVIDEMTGQLSLFPDEE